MVQVGCVIEGGSSDEINSVLTRPTIGCTDDPRGRGALSCSALIYLKHGQDADKR